jgi:tetratricopeptide (TPR) repeat protein
MNIPHSQRRTLVVVLTLLAILCLPSVALAKDTWTSVRSKNFFLVGNASETDIRKVATRLEQFREVFTRLFTNAKFDSPVPTTVIVFKSKDSYRPFNPGDNAGYFQKGPDVNYITLTTDLSGQNPFSVIYHEYVHMLVDNNNGNVPAWFNEGLAEYYSSFDMQEDRKARLGDLIPYHLEVLRDEKLLPLRTLFAVDHYSPYYNERGKRGIFYAESWALVHYLILGNGGQYRPQLSKFVGLLAANVKIEEAYRQAFQMDIETLEKELKKYIQGSTFRMQIATWDHKLEFDSEMKVAALTEAQAQGYLGDLLSHVNRLNDAEVRLQQALSLDPNLTMAHASLGIVRARQGRFEDAKKNLQEAVNGDSNNYLTHYYYAFALSREGMNENDVVHNYAPENVSKMRAELKRAIELNPTFPESYSLLSFVNLVTGDQLEESVNLLKQALKLSPGRQDFELMLAQVYFRQEKLDLAKQTLERLAIGKDRTLQQQAKSILASINSYESQLTQYKSQAEESKSGGPPMLRERGETSTVEVTQETAGPRSAMDYLQEALRPVEEGEQRIQGLFTKLDCDNSKGIAYFIVQAADRTYKIRATSLGQIQLVAFTPNPGQVRCGVNKSQDNAVITFRPAKDPKDIKAKIDGDAIALELVPKDFKLKN